MKRLSRKKSLVLITLFILAVLVDIYYETNVFKVSKVHFKSNKITNDSSIKLVQISDLHAKVFGDNNQKLIQTIKNQQPDIVVITGDIIDRKTNSLQDVFHLIEEIIAFQQQVYFVSGNHEWGNNLRNELLSGLEQRGVQILNNNSVEIMIKEINLNLVGIDDVSTNHEDMKKAFTNVKNLEYTVLLSHSPAVTDKYRDIDADLILSGHTHGGQVRFPLIGPIIAPDEGVFPKKTKSVYQLKENQSLYIDSGLGTSLVPVRFLNQSQLSVIEITN
ncbi:hypothetical protein AQ616_10225 [Oceanobacillus sp. E9]|uniref:Phosphoesterase n=1 Tax=Oceanobacillus kimchii TaxID=746691 RepID=A0ABQ5TI68_9BACI|nr:MULTISPECIES: metallophosphoesterase [Oceanobacillus]OEH54131.1 hypothetical protein AQ616_10225 [Oceanobacillus sp. E9]GLO65426.1 phosphoesterase [Oceanobacillus kimchii]